MLENILLFIIPIILNVVCFVNNYIFINYILEFIQSNT